MRINRIKIITRMAEKDLNVNKVAELAGVSRVTVTAVKTGKSCSIETAQKLAAALGVSVDELIEKEA